MSEGQVAIAVDAMGGENSPYKVLKGVEIFLQKEKNTKFIFFGDELLINQNIKKNNLNIFNFEIVNTEDIISDEEWFFGKKINKLDISILPFIRQFRIADADWFDNHKRLKKVKNYLHNFLASKILKDVMINYDVWKEESEISYFPITNR